LFQINLAGHHKTAISTPKMALCCLIVNAADHQAGQEKPIKSVLIQAFPKIKNPAMTNGNRVEWHAQQIPLRSD
jgi:hypothetical protein